MARQTSRPTIRDVADRASVDISVVSKVLRNDPGLRIRDETRLRVINAVEELQYRPNVYAQGLATARTGVIGLLVPDFMNPVYAEIISGAEEAARERDLRIWTASSAGYGPDQYSAMIRDGLVDGLLVAGQRVGDPKPDQMADGHVPTLLVNRRTPGADRWIILEDQRAAYTLTQHLLDLGHRDIGFVGDPDYADTGARRLDGFLTAMADARLQPSDAHLISADFSPEGGRAAAEKLLAAPEPPTAVVVGNALAALGVMQHVGASGLRIPDDISVVAIHQLPNEPYRNPELTCVKLPLRALGRRATELLITMPDSAPIHEVLVGDLMVIPGDTAQPPRR